MLAQGKFARGINIFQATQCKAVANECLVVEYTADKLTLCDKKNTFAQCP